MAGLEPRVAPRVYGRDGFAITFWTYHEPVSSRGVAPAAYADALERLHAGVRNLDVTTPHFTDRVAEAQHLVASPDHTPALADGDRELLGTTLRGLRRAIDDRGAGEQQLHGEPHPGNLLSTTDGPLFIDLETCCRGPVEFDLAHVPKTSASAIRTSIKHSSATAGGSSLRWSRRGAGIAATSSRTGNERPETSSTPFGRVHRTRRSMR